MKKYIKNYIEQTNNQGNYFIGTRTELIEKFGKYIANPSPAYKDTEKLVWYGSWLREKVTPLCLLSEVYMSHFIDDIENHFDLSNIVPPLSKSELHTLIKKCENILNFNLKGYNLKTIEANIVKYKNQLEKL